MRLLAALDSPAARQTPAKACAGPDFGPALAGWFDWTDAIALAAAVNGPAEPARPVGATSAQALRTEERELARLKAGLLKAIVGPPPAPVTLPGLRPPPGLPPATDFAAQRERVLDLQQAMNAGVARLRKRVRATLAATSPALARLAELDAVLEPVVGAREHALLAGVALRLERRFERLRDAAAPAAGEIPLTDRPGEWLDTFRDEMRDVLLAELEFRLLPVEGLLDALRHALPALP